MFRPLCVCWAYASVTYAHAECARQELMHAQSIRVRNWCVHWAYASGTNTCTERSPFKTCWAYASGTDVYPEHTHQELMRMLSIRISSLRVRSECASKTKCGIAPSKSKLIFLPTNHLPMKTLWCKNQENPSERISHAWAFLRVSCIGHFWIFELSGFELELRQQTVACFQHSQPPSRA